MAHSLAQIEAARRNGARSKGPVTPEGKARSSQNAIKHGLYSSTAVLHNESASHFEQLLARLVEQYQPRDVEQEELVHDLATSLWRRDRVIALETAGIDHEVDRRRPEIASSYEVIDEATQSHLAIAALTQESRTLTWYSRQEGRLRRAIRDARAKLEKCRNEPAGGVLAHTGENGASEAE